MNTTKHWLAALAILCSVTTLPGRSGMAARAADQPPKAPKTPAVVAFIEAWSPAPGTVDVCWITSAAAPTGVVEYTDGQNTRRASVDVKSARNHRVRLSGLDADKEYRAWIVTDGAKSEPVTFRACPPKPAPTQPQVIPLTVPEPTGQARKAWPAVVGMPFGRGMLADVRDLRLKDASGASVALQAEPLSRWADGSVQWCTLSFLADTAGKDQPPATYQLEAGPNQPSSNAPAAMLSMTQYDQAWQLRTDRQTLTIMRRGSGLFQLGGLAPAQLELTAADGNMLKAAPPDADGVCIESNGPVRAVVRMTGTFVDPAGKPAWRYIARLTFWKNHSIVGLDLSVLNDQPKPRFAAVKSLDLHLPLSAAATKGGIDDATEQPLPHDGAFSLLQDKESHFQLTSGGKTIEGNRANGWACAADDRTRVAAFMPDFRQTYPKGYAVQPDGLHVQLLPPLPADAYADPASLKVFHRLYAWYDRGNYLFRAGQLTRNQIYLQVDEPAAARDSSRFGAWLANPLLPQAPAEYLCNTAVLGRKLFAPKAGVWDEYETVFAKLFAASMKNRDDVGSYGWMNYGDWFGERVLNYGNNEYDMAWTLAVQWMRTGRREYFDRGLQMARHCSSVDTVHGAFSDSMNGLVYEHSFNHLGTEKTPEQLYLASAGGRGTNYLQQYGKSMFLGAIDRQGHVFQEGNWIYAALTGDRFLWDVANRVCTNQAEKLTVNFDFGIERAGGWPLINASAAYRHTGNPYYLNAARLMIERCLQRQDPATGGWLHRPPLNETDNVPTLGGKAFATGILCNGILRYLDVEPRQRDDVKRMVVRGVDWLMNESWLPGHGFRYISNCEKYRNIGGRGATSLLLCETVAFAYEQTHDVKYRDFWVEMLGDSLRTATGSLGKEFTQCLRQTIFGLDRAAAWGQTSLPETAKK